MPRRFPDALLGLRLALVAGATAIRCLNRASTPRPPILASCRRCRPATRPCTRSISAMARNFGARHPAVGPGLARRVAFQLALEQSDRQGPLARRAGDGPLSRQLAGPDLDRSGVAFPAGRKQLAEFIALFKARPECFGNSRFVVGDPWKDEPYGYCCTDGKRAFLALHNACWHDSRLPLELNPAWAYGPAGPGTFTAGIPIRRNCQERQRRPVWRENGHRAPPLRHRAAGGRRARSIGLAGP